MSKYFVQFPHRGVEAKPVNGGTTIRWNKSNLHFRKFLQSQGNYIDKEEVKSGNLAFWGEWEAPSKCIELGGGGMNRYIDNKLNPRYINTPFLNIHEEGRVQNTDPYVFGDKFRYLICRQRKCSEILISLDKGSLILFGSKRGNEFRLDTVFVVSSIQKAYRRQLIEELGIIDESYIHASLNPVKQGNYEENSNERNAANGCIGAVVDFDFDYKYYEGVMYGDDNEGVGMYSFVPCKVITDIKYYWQYAFVQPVIKLDSLIDNNVCQNIKSKKIDDIEVLKKIWLRIKQQVEDQGLKLGVKLETPRII